MTRVLERAALLFPNLQGHDWLKLGGFHHAR